MQVTVDAVELLAGLEHAGGAPAQRHLPVTPAFDVLGVLAADPRSSTRSSLVKRPRSRGVELAWADL